MSRLADRPERSFRRCVRTAAVLAVLSNLISAEHDASAFSKAGSIFIFTFFKQTPVFLGENVRCKVKRILGDTPNSQKFVRYKVRGTDLWRENFIPAVPANRRKECPL